MTNVHEMLAIVIVLVCFLINVKSGECFGMDVHHRYSDTVKQFLDLDGLPAEGTMDYYSAMAHRDHLFKARRLAGGSDGDTKPSSSSIYTFLSGSGNITYRISSLGHLHYSVVLVGTPPLEYVVALDTGSDLFWLPCDCPTCARNFTLNGQRIDLNIYSPSASSTSSLLPCNSTLCSVRGKGCAAKRNACIYQESYIPSFSSSTGILVDDVLRFTTDEIPQNPVTVPVTLGCGLIQTGDFMNDAAVNGLFGLGIHNISVPSILASKGIVPANSFSMCFGPKGLGKIEFGHKGSPDQKVTPFNLHQLYPTYNITVTQISVGTNVTNLTFPATFDSGVSYTYLSDPAYTFITENFNSRISEQRYIPGNSTVFDFCYALSANVTKYNTPRLSFTMEGGDEFNVTAPTVLIPRTGGNAYCLALVKSEDINIIGQNFMTGYRIVFDREEMILGWKESACLDSVSNIVPTSAPPPSSLVPDATSRNRTGSSLSDPPPPPPIRPPSGNNAAHLSSISTNILVVTSSFVFHYFIVLYL